MIIQIIINDETKAIENVIVGDKETEQITPDETIGLIAALVMPEPRYCLSWLQTKEHREAIKKEWQKRYTSSI